MPPLLLRRPLSPIEVVGRCLLLTVAIATLTGLLESEFRKLVALPFDREEWQIHRGVVVNIHAVRSARRSIAGHLDLKLKARPETLRVSSAHAYRFKHM